MTFDAALLVQDVFRLLAAVFLGGAVGWQRQRREKPAGMRTHMLVAMGSAAFTLLTLELYRQTAAGQETSQADPLRIVDGWVK